MTMIIINKNLQHKELATMPKQHYRRALCSLAHKSIRS